MTIHLPWKAKVVRRLLALAMLLVQINSAFGQSPNTSKITCSFASTDFEAVINHLATSAGVYFVYSTNKIKVTKSITLFAKDKSLSEVLELLGKQLDVVFKMDGKHITIKADDHVGQRNLSTAPISRSKNGNLSQTENLSSFAQLPVVTKYFEPVAPPTTDLYADSDRLTKQAAKLQRYFNPAFLKNVPSSYVRRISTNNLHRGWFVSVGLTINDYSSGLELQAGLRSAYLVYAPTMLRSGDFHGGYGVGSSINLNNNFSFNPVYLFANVGGSESYFRLNELGIPFRVLAEHKATHHQFKMMLQYAVMPNLLVKLGPTFNQTSTTYRYTESAVVLVQVTRNSYPSNTTFQTFTPSYTQGVARYQDIHSNDFWIGWEASVSFKFNFLQAK